MEASGITKSKSSFFYGYLFLLLIVVLGFVLRLIHLQFYLFSSSTDSMGYSYTALLYSRGEWLSPRATSKGFFLTLLISLFYKIFGPTFLAGQLVSLLFGSLLPIITFFLGSALFNKKAGLLGAFIVSINPLLILYSCLTFREMLYSFTWMCYVYFALRGFRGNTFYSILGGIFFGLSSMTVEVEIFAGIGLILYFIIQKTMKNKKRACECKNLDVFFCSGLLTLSPLFIRDYLLRGDPLFTWWRDDPQWAIIMNPIRVYVAFIALSIPYIILFRVFFRNLKRPSIIRYPNAVKASLIGFVVIATLLVAGFVSGLFRGGIAALVTGTVVGFMKFAEQLAFPESLGFLAIFSIFGIAYVLLKSNDRTTLSLSVFLFSCTPRAALVPMTLSYFSFTEILALQETFTWPFSILFRYVAPFIPLLSIFASYGILFLCDKLSGKLKKDPTNSSTIEKSVDSRNNQKIRINKNRVFKTGLISVIILGILFQYIYAETDLFARADSHDSYQHPTRPANVELSWWIREGGEGTSLIDWLHSQGSPVVYSFNSLFKEQYGEDKVILLTDESPLDIVKRARQERIQFIISDALGDYSDAQYALFWGGFFKNPVRINGQNLGYFKLVRSYYHWHMAQIYNISFPTGTALVVQGTASSGGEWVYFLSNSPSPYLVQVVDDEENLMEHFTGDYDVIVLAEIQRRLEDNELSVLRENVEKGTILILSGISPAYVNLEKNSYWLGAKNFAEAPKEAKWNITFTEDALNVLTEINLNKSYALSSQSFWSSPTGCTSIDPDVLVYAKRVEDGATTIFAKSYFNGVVIFSGVRHVHASKANDYGLYIKFIQNLLEKASNKTLSPLT